MFAIEQSLVEMEILNIRTKLETKISKKVDQFLSILNDEYGDNDKLYIRPMIERTHEHAD